MNNQMIAYGAAELKLAYNRNLLKAFALATLTLGGCFAAYRMLSNNGTTESLIRRLHIPPPIEIWDDVKIIKEEPKGATSEGNGKGEQAATGSGNKDGRVLKPWEQKIRLVTDETVLDDTVDVKNDLPSSRDGKEVLDEGGNGLDGDGSKDDGGGGEKGKEGNGGGESNTARSASDDDVLKEVVFIPHEVEPQYDVDGLRSRLRYPEMASRNRLEGRVVLSVFVDRDGTPLKTIVEQSDNRIFVEAAVNAVMSTLFTPAEQNGEPVGVWVQLPIEFRLP